MVHEGKAHTFSFVFLFSVRAQSSTTVVTRSRLLVVCSIVCWLIIISISTADMRIRELNSPLAPPPLPPPPLYSSSSLLQKSFVQSSIHSPSTTNSYVPLAVAVSWDWINLHLMWKVVYRPLLFLAYTSRLNNIEVLLEARFGKSSGCVVFFQSPPLGGGCSDGLLFGSQLS